MEVRGAVVVVVVCATIAAMVIVVDVWDELSAVSTSTVGMVRLMYS